jgi:hypothetical protein
MLPKPRAPRALTAGGVIYHWRAGPTAPKQLGARACAIIMARQPKGRGAPSRPPATSPTTHAAASLEKARPPHTSAATTVGI